jgi:two-component system, OmpR family, response regulator MtrA
VPTVTVADLVRARLPIVVCSSTHPGTPLRIARRLGGGVVLVGRDLRALLGVVSGDLPDGPPGRQGDPPGHPGGPLSLTRLECELITRLGTEPLRVWRYERLLATVWGAAHSGDYPILYSAVKRLRPKLRAAGYGNCVQTVRGVGYRLVMP